MLEIWGEWTPASYACGRCLEVAMAQLLIIETMKTSECFH